MRSQAPPSFCSERTVEYFAPPRLTSLLVSDGVRVVPFYFWSTRVGSSIAKVAAPRAPARVVACFACRPRPTHASAIAVKIDSQLFETAALPATHGIPVLAAVPLAPNLGKLSDQTECLWLSIDGKAPATDGWGVVGSGLESRAIEPRLPGVEILSGAEVRQISRAAFEFPDISNAFAPLREVNRLSRAGLARVHWRFGTPHRPVHLALFIVL